jgi:glycogen operon protein
VIYTVTCGLAHQTDRNISAGNSEKLGATICREGVNFALFSQYAQEVFLLLFDSPDSEPTDVIKIENKTDNVWHVLVHGIGAGQLYGYKVRGRFNPRLAMRFNEHKLLLDPYTKAITGKCVNRNNLLLGYRPDSRIRDLSMDKRDNAGTMAKCVVIDDSFDWQGDVRPDVSVDSMIIYEVHLKAFTAHPSSAVARPGTYLGFIEKIPYLKELGINAVEFLPIHEHHVSDMLVSKGLTEFWGYNTIGFFAPESSYCSSGETGSCVDEFKTLVRELHKAGIKVILDVVYNHTGEGNELGPTICFKGIDNPTYYALSGTKRHPYRYYVNDTGCGNTLNLENPAVLRMVMDSLRYWYEVMHVDGFRFDLASILARVEMQYNTKAAFFEAIAKDECLQHALLIAEPWDLTTYQVGNFPVRWSEWNGRYRDNVRKFLRGDSGQVAELGWRLSGSADLYKDAGRYPHHSVNFVTCHDGFTLNDLYSYNWKHNEANLENNWDGTGENRSWNCGSEGETSDPIVILQRKRMIRNAICTLFLSLGTPMMLYGDEVRRTQKGNNNVYCQDNELSWFDWSQVERNGDLLEFFQKAIDFRKRYSILQSGKFFSGEGENVDGIPDITWYSHDLESPNWSNLDTRLLCCHLNGGERPSDQGTYHLFVILNADANAHTVSLPQHNAIEWKRVVDTSLPEGDDFLGPGGEAELETPDEYVANPRTVVVLLSRE